MLLTALLVEETIDETHQVLLDYLKNEKVNKIVQSKIINVLSGNDEATESLKLSDIEKRWFPEHRPSKALAGFTA